MKITDVVVKRYGQRGEGGRIGSEIHTVEVQTDGGVSGLGFVTANNSRLSSTADLVAGVLRQNLRNIVLGQDPMYTDALWRRMYDTVVGRRGARGFLLHCIAAIDFACWDIKGKVAERRSATCLGQRRELIPTYANCAHHMPPAELAQRARSTSTRAIRR